MAKISANGATITLTITGTAHVISPDVDAYEIKRDRTLEDSSGFGEIGNTLPGQRTHEVTMDIWHNATGTAFGVANVLDICWRNNIPVQISIVPASGSKTYSGTFYPQGFSTIGEKKGSPVKLGTVTFKPANGYAEPTES